MTTERLTLTQKLVLADVLGEYPRDYWPTRQELVTLKALHRKGFVERTPFAYKATQKAIEWRDDVVNVEEPESER